MTTDTFQRKLTAILSADVVGYSRLMREDEEATVHTLNKYKEMIFGIIERHNGRLVDSPGDNVLAEFVSVVDAVRCGVEIQEDLKASNEELPPNRKMEFRIGINTGDVIQDGDRIYGDGVNVAARIESLADPGGICISRTAYDQVKNKINIDYEYLGDYEVKNISEPVQVYRIRMESEAPTVKEKTGKASSRTWQIAALVMAVFIVGAVAIWYFSFRQAEEAPKTIAVLPFEDLSPENDQEYFVDGLSEELINSLTKIPDLRVTSRTSSFSFKGSDKTLQEIASVLDVENILEGSVRKAGNALRITAQLIRVKDDYHLWSQTYNRELKDIFVVQEDIANSVTRELKVTLGIDRSRRQLGVTDNPEAYELYLVAKGQYNTQSGDPDLVLELIDRAITIDPEFAVAWVMKAVVLSSYVIRESDKGRVASLLDEGLNAAQRAIELEPNLAAGYASLGLYRTVDGEWIEAELAYRKAFELATEPITDLVPQIPHHYMAVGFPARAKELFEEIRQNDPLNTPNLFWYIYCLGLLGDTQGAEAENKRGSALFGWTLRGWGQTCASLGNDLYLSSEEIAFDDPNLDKVVLKEHFKSPEEGLAELRRLYNGVDNIRSLDFIAISILAAYFGDSDLAMDAIERAHNFDATLVHALWFPVMREVRQLPRFKEFVREIGLVDYWEKFGWPDICHKLDNGDFECD